MFCNMSAPVILIDSVYRKDEKYYPKVFLDQNYVFLQEYFDDSDERTSNKEN